MSSNDIVPGVVHVYFEGRIVKSGDMHLALALEQPGFRRIEEYVNVSEAGRSYEGTFGP
jgi:Fe-S cluster assembly ATPase SufC